MSEDLNVGAEEVTEETPVVETPVEEVVEETPVEEVVEAEIVEQFLVGVKTHKLVDMSQGQAVATPNRHGRVRFPFHQLFLLLIMNIYI